MRSVWTRARALAVAVLALGATLALTMLAPPAPARASGLPDARGAWTFDEGAGPWQSAGTDGTLSARLGSAAQAQKSDVAALGQIVRLGDGGVGEVRVPSALDASAGDFTISLWVKADPSTSSNAKTALLQLSGAGRTLLYERSDGELVTYIAGADLSLGTDPSRGDWEHLVFVKSGAGADGAVALYVDGEQTGRAALSGSVPAGTFDLIVGSHKNPNDMGHLVGNVDELRIYDEALTAEQVAELHQSYADVISELEAAGARAELRALVDEGRALLEGLGETDDPAVDALGSALDAAEAALAGTDAAAIGSARATLEEALAAARALPVTVSVDPADVERSLDRAVFGINHRYAFNGYGSFDPETGRVRDDFAALYDEAGFGSIRYPGGTISNLFAWKETLGDPAQRTPQIHGFFNNPNQHGIAPNFGISEIGSFAQEHGSEIVWVYGLGRGDANDAADLVEFLNADAGTNPNGGTAWADVRASLGHPEPYGVRYFEIGNEMNQVYAEGTSSQAYWTANVPGGALEGYVNGGTASFSRQYAVRRGDWNESASFSTGEPGQEFGMRYALQERDERAADYEGWTAVDVASVHVFVDDEEWHRVDGLSSAAADARVFELDEKSGFFTFGDGTHGAVPARGAQVSVTYSVERDGFVNVSRAMRATMEQINADRAAAGELHVYSSFETEGFVRQMHAQGADALYDGLTIHPYSGTPEGGSSGAAAELAFYLSAMKKGDDQAAHVASYVELMRSYDPTKVPVISEYGIFRSTDPLVRSQTHALYIARAIMEYVRLGSPYIQKHCLVDWYSEGADALGPTQQAVIQAVPGAGASTATGEGSFTFFKTPSASVFEMLNSGFGTSVVSSTASFEPTLSNGVSQYETLASTAEDGTVYLALVNLGLDEGASVRLSVEGQDLTGRDLVVRSLSGDGFQAANTPDDPERVGIDERSLVADEAAPVLEVAPHSFTLIEVPPAPDPEPEPELVTVTFDDGLGGVTTERVEKNTAVGRPADPVREGYDFLGWFASDEASEPWDFTQPVTSDLALAARWERVDAGEEPGGEPGGQPGGEQPGNGQPGDQPGSGDRPGDDAPGADRPSVDRPATDDRPAGSARPSDSASGTLPTTGDPALAAAVPAALAAAALLASRALKR